jgi:hypothetical protein
MSDTYLTRDELTTLTGTKQPKRMAAWLEARHWVFEPPERRSEIPRVARAYHDAKMSGEQPGRTRRRGDYSFMTEPA